MRPAYHLRLSIIMKFKIYQEPKTYDKNLYQLPLFSFNIGGRGKCSIKETTSDEGRSGECGKLVSFKGKKVKIAEIKQINKTWLILQYA